MCGGGVVLTYIVVLTSPPPTRRNSRRTPLLGLIDRIILPCAALDPPDGLDLGVQALQGHLQGWSRSSTIGEVISKCHFE